uniref:Uncharacterized protein n=1 Tax=Glossina austeni TaxID=7395 RepID=A0A1A9UHF7_GLOAU
MFNNLNCVIKIFNQSFACKQRLAALGNDKEILTARIENIEKKTHKGLKTSCLAPNKSIKPYHSNGFTNISFFLYRIYIILYVFFKDESIKIPLHEIRANAFLTLNKSISNS